MSTLQDLLAQKAELERKIQETQRSERAAAIEKVRALMAEFVLSVEDLNGKAPASSGRKKSGDGTRKAAVKYRDSAGNTWSGRGLQPRWLKEALAGGKALQDFAV